MIFLRYIKLLPAKNFNKGAKQKKTKISYHKMQSFAYLTDNQTIINNSTIFNYKKGYFYEEKTPVKVVILFI